jgi:SapC
MLQQIVPWHTSTMPMRQDVELVLQPGRDHLTKRIIPMTKYVPVTATHHRGKAWRRSGTYAHAAGIAAVPLVGVEFGRAAIAMPIGFLKHLNRYVPMAMMSPVAGRNLFIGPAFQWLGSYVPAALRVYPFRLGHTNETEQAILCVDEDSGLIGDADGIAEEFFDADGNPPPATKAAMEFLARIEANRIATDLAVAALDDAGLIQPWSLKIMNDGQETPIDDLFKVDEAALNSCDNETFLKLRKSGALPLAYMQLLSMGQVNVFEQLIRLQQQLAPPKQRQISSLDEIFEMASNDTLKFN